jgi:ABC-type sugar transport system permease subunit
MGSTIRPMATTSSRIRGSRRERFRRHMLHNRLAYLLMLPSVILILLIYFYPLGSGLWQSLHNFNRVKPWAYRFIGLSNYATALGQHQFWLALRTSAIWTIGGVALSYLLGLICALLLNERFKLRGIYRAILLLPWVVPGVVSGTGWLWMFNDQIGMINRSLRALGIIDQPIFWLAKPHLAMTAVITVHVWQAFPFMMITILSALSGIPDDIYEAGRIDGASSWQLFRYITFPLILPVSVIATLLSSIWTFNDFGTIWVMTGGGPANATTTLIIQAYKEAFQRFNVGYGTALAVIAMILMLGVGAVYLRLQARFQDMW